MPNTLSAKTGTVTPTARAMPIRAILGAHAGAGDSAGRRASTSRNTTMVSVSTRNWVIARSGRALDQVHDGERVATAAEQHGGGEAGAGECDGDGEHAGHERRHELDRRVREPWTGDRIGGARSNAATSDAASVVNTDCERRRSSEMVVASPTIVRMMKPASMARPPAPVTRKARVAAARDVLVVEADQQERCDRGELPEDEERQQPIGPHDAEHRSGEADEQAGEPTEVVAGPRPK